MDMMIFQTYSTSNNETPPISYVLIGRHCLFADFWRHCRAVTRLENVRQSNIRSDNEFISLSIGLLIILITRHCPFPKIGRLHMFYMRSGSSWENSCAGFHSYLSCRLRHATLSKGILRYRRFPVNISSFLRELSLQKKHREAASAFLFKLFSVDPFIVFLALLPFCWF